MHGKLQVVFTEQDAGLCSVCFLSYRHWYVAFKRWELKESSMSGLSLPVCYVALNSDGNFPMALASRSLTGQ